MLPRPQAQIVSEQRSLGLLTLLTQCPVQGGFGDAEPGSDVLSGLQAPRCLSGVFRPSPYDGLKDVAQAASLGKFKGRLVFLRDLNALRATEVWLEGVPPGKISHLAGEARVTEVADLRKVLDEDKRLTLITGLLHTVRTGVRDDVVTMFCKRMAAIHKKALCS
ncbi:hypothetical protein [Streptosporangium sp. NPDC004631]